MDPKKHYCDLCERVFFIFSSRISSLKFRSLIPFLVEKWRKMKGETKLLIINKALLVKLINTF